MTTRRRPLQRDDLDIETWAKRALGQAPEVELGWSALRREMAEAGWPSKTPAGDHRRAAPRITVRCRVCNAGLTGSAGKDEHREQTGHDAYEYTPQDASTEPSTIDYADPTGELAMNFDRLVDDLFELQDLHSVMTKAWRQIVLITRAHIPANAPCLPACAVTTCDAHVEYTPSGKGFRGMEQIAGHWVAKPGVRPVCAKHRSEDRRAS